MIKYILSAISNGLAFSKVESKGTFILAALTILMLFAAKIANNHIRSTESISTDSLALAQWVQQVEATYSIKEPQQRELYKKSTTKIASAKSIKKTDKSHRKPEKEAIVIHDLNTVTPEGLRVVNGIGKVYSERIVKYRKMLGGFNSETQLLEVYGLDSLLMKKILERFQIQTSVRPIPINSDSVKLLASHPYISYDLAWLIINFRRQNGNITSISDLSKIKAVNDSLLQKLSPYISK